MNSLKPGYRGPMTVITRKSARDYVDEAEDR